MTPASSAIVLTCATKSASGIRARTKRGVIRVGSTASGSTHGCRRSVLAGIFFFPCHRPGSANGKSHSAFECRRPFGVAGPTGCRASGTAIVSLLRLNAVNSVAKKLRAQVPVDAFKRPVEQRRLAPARGSHQEADDRERREAVHRRPEAVRDQEGLEIPPERAGI